MSVIRGTALSGYAELVRELGGDPSALLRSAGVPSGAAGDADVFLGYRNLIGAVESAARATDTADFGRRLGRRQGIEILGPVGAAAQSAPTVGAALASVSHYLRVYSPALSIAVEPMPDPAELTCRFDIELDHLPDHRQTTELTLTVALRISRLLVGPGFRPRRVHLPHARMTAESSYRSDFGCPARFEEPFAAFVLATTDLDRPLAPDGGVHQVVRAYLDGALGPDGQDVVTSVRVLVRHLLPTGSADLPTVARQLSVHPRTLQRRLAERATTYDALVDALRQDVATDYLRDTDLPMGQVAGLLGYSAQAVLTRSAHRWFGCSPREARRHLRGPTA